MPPTSVITVRILGQHELDALDHVAPGVFDGPIAPALRDEFLRDSRHHLAVAVTSEGLVVGMASAVHYVHPDKPPQMFINEVGVSPEYQGQGIGRRLVQALLERAVELACTEAWVLTEASNTAAMALYRSAGGSPADSPSIMFTFSLNID